MKKSIKIMITAVLLCGLTACGDTTSLATKDTETMIGGIEKITEEAATDHAADEVSEEEETDAVTEQPQTEENSMDAADSGKDGFSDKETMSHSDESYFGTWKITAYHMPGVSAISDTEAEGYIGKTCTYSADVFNGDGEVTDYPDYQEFEQTADDFTAAYKIALESIGITSETVKGVNVSNALGFGCNFLIKDEKTILITWDGVFFEAERQ